MFYVYVWSLRYPKCNAHASYCHLYPVRLYSTIPQDKRYDFEKKVFEHKMCVWIFLQLMTNISHSKRNWARYDQKCILVFTLSTRYYCQILIKQSFSTCFRKYWIMIFHENPSSGSRVVPCGRTRRQPYMMKLIVAFRNFTNEELK
jgi:hypothetical protein